MKKYSVDWCGFYFKEWTELCNKYKPKTILEIGSFEGRSAEFWLNQPNTKEVTCVDTWEGSIEHSDLNLSNIELTFDINHGSNPKIIKQKGKSTDVLPLLSKTYKNYYDLIYVDGSHDPRDVLFDAVMSFQLLKVGGIIIFDDYLWINRMRFGPWHGDLPSVILPHPKQSIDAFCNIYETNIKILNINYQLILEKIC